MYLGRGLVQRGVRRVALGTGFQKDSVGAPVVGTGNSPTPSARLGSEGLAPEGSVRVAQQSTTGEVLLVNTRGPCSLLPKGSKGWHERQHLVFFHRGRHRSQGAGDHTKGTKGEGRQTYLLSLSISLSISLFWYESI